MTDAEFANLCAGHPDLSFEMTAEGELIVMPATFSMPGLRNAEIGFQLQAWAKRDRRGVVADSSTVFVPPIGARRSPNASWILKSRVLQLDPAAREGFCIFVRTSSLNCDPADGEIRGGTRNIFVADEVLSFFSPIFVPFTKTSYSLRKPPIVSTNSSVFSPFESPTNPRFVQLLETTRLSGILPHFADEESARSWDRRCSLKVSIGSCICGKAC